MDDFIIAFYLFRLSHLFFLMCVLCHPPQINFAFDHGAEDVAMLEALYAYLMYLRLLVKNVI